MNAQQEAAFLESAIRYDESFRANPINVHHDEYIISCIRIFLTVMYVLFSAAVYTHLPTERLGPLFGALAAAGTLIIALAAFWASGAIAYALATGFFPSVWHWLRGK